ncbi:uncharacterized protein N7525_002555 [Penicillium rubens]|uniref:uncharacterized protein n=1 Tax=Penicillium rubens TaxID=1108849 RepID=UPI002A5A16BE|nr:uncharacterized protein N7525_002555 [Penicillium rubens]KAJ5837367.1 hypothetical protein N7525_002555 [Penicillium rubens]KAJ5865557.1 hypothetical protein N7534_000110 [Penicillium rubens]
MEEHQIIIKSSSSNYQPRRQHATKAKQTLSERTNPLVLRVTYRDGKIHGAPLVLNLESIFRRPRNQHEGDIIISVQSLEAMYQQVHSYLLASSAYDSLMQNDYISQGYAEPSSMLFILSTQVKIVYYS